MLNIISFETLNVLCYATEGSAKNLGSVPSEAMFPLLMKPMPVDKLCCSLNKQILKIVPAMKSDMKI